MNSASQHVHGHLPRLPREAYQGRAFVHWTMCVRDRRQGWLSPAVHARMREVLTHAAAIYELACPVYYLMPDHAHFLWVGLKPASDLRAAAIFFRRHTASVLAPFAWQREPYDHVLREHEREQGAFQSTAHYILENPVRASLAPCASDYAFSGCLVLGWPGWTPFAADFWLRFWEHYARP